MVPLTDEQIERAALELCKIRGWPDDRGTESDWVRFVDGARTDILRADAIFVALHNARSQP